MTIMNYDNSVVIYTYIHCHSTVNCCNYQQLLSFYTHLLQHLLTYATHKSYFTKCKILAYVERRVIMSNYKRKLLYFPSPTIGRTIKEKNPLTFINNSGSDLCKCCCCHLYSAFIWSVDFEIMTKSAVKP